jgi:hypothetical protein
MEASHVLQAEVESFENRWLNPHHGHVKYKYL